MSLDLPASLQLRQDRGEKWLIVDVDQQRLADWCLSLFLIRDGLLDCVQLTDGPRSMKLQVGVRDDVGQAERARARWLKRELRLVLSRDELEFWLQFFATYYRDGVASVDHIDTEARGQSGGTEVMVVFRVPNSLPAISSEELARRLSE